MRAPLQSASRVHAPRPSSRAPVDRRTRRTPTRSEYSVVAEALARTVTQWQILKAVETGEWLRSRLVQPHKAVRMADAAEQVSLAERLRDEERAYTVRVRQPNGKTSGRMHAYAYTTSPPNFVSWPLIGIESGHLHIALF